MNKPITLCDRCDNALHCLLNFDGKPCRENRTVEPSNADLVRQMTDEELAQAIEEFSYEVVSCPKDKCHLEQMSPYDSLDRNECRKCWLSWLKSPVELG